MFNDRLDGGFFVVPRYRVKPELIPTGVLRFCRLLDPVLFQIR